MTRIALLLAACLAAPAAFAQESGSPFLVDEDALDRRYGVGGEGGSATLPPAKGAELGAAPRAGFRHETPPDRSEPRGVGGDVVDERGVIQPDSRPFIRF